ncbi:hypothetical protein BCR44DRAFT_40701, partial [Catenaria anguillulae PL171]
MHIANGDESHPHMSCALDWKRFRAESIRHTGHFGGQDRQTARAARFPHAMTRQHMGWCGSAMLKEHGLGMHCGPDPPWDALRTRPTIRFAKRDRNNNKTKSVCARRTYPSQNKSECGGRWAGVAVQCNGWKV